MHRVYLTDEQRIKIIDTVKPSINAYWTYDTMDLVTGIYDEENNCLLTKIYHLHEGIRRSGDHYSEYKFLLFIGDKAYKKECLFYTDTKEYKLLDVSEQSPELSDERLMDMIKLYFSYYGEYVSILAKLAEEKFGLKGDDFVYFNKRFLEEKINLIPLNSGIKGKGIEM